MLIYTRNLLPSLPRFPISWMVKYRYVHPERLSQRIAAHVLKLSRPQTVKRLWQYIRENDLQDPNDRRQIRCDERMRKVFKQDRVHMFTMTKILNQNLYTPDE
jgi:upstream activation factor subunit UAF30